jgi:nicotinamide-nucleotide adenylyltransferase
MKTGIVLARLQPIHNGHLELIEQAIDENDQVFVFIGSADKFNQRNPIPINLRIEMAQEAIDNLLKKYSGAVPTVKVIPLDDLTDESDNSHDWGFYLYSKIVTTTGDPYFTIYYSDGFEIITTWFPPFILRNNVSLKLIARGATCSGISATQVRNMIETENWEELHKWVPESVFTRRESIRKHIELAKLIK